MMKCGDDEDDEDDEDDDVKWRRCVGGGGMRMDGMNSGELGCELGRNMLRLINGVDKNEHDVDNMMTSSSSPPMTSSILIPPPPTHLLSHPFKCQKHGRVTSPEEDEMTLMMLMKMMLMLMGRMMKMMMMMYMMVEMMCI